MTTRKNDPGAECRKKLARFAKELVTAAPVRRAELVARVQTTALPAVLASLAEQLVKRLGNEKEHAGAANVLVALGPGVLPTLESAVFKKQPEVLVVRLAPVFVALGRQLPERARVQLQLNLGIAVAFAQTTEGRAALEAAMVELRDDGSMKVEPSGAVPGD